jgi:hypothetical protein
VQARTINLDTVDHLGFLHVSETGCISVIGCKNGNSPIQLRPLESLSQLLDHYSVAWMDNVKK